MSKKKIDLLFIVFREETPGHKDIDHLLPFLYFFKRHSNFELKSRILILENECNYQKKIDPRINFLLNIKNLQIRFLFKNSLFLFLKKLIKFSSNINFLGKVLDKLFNKFYLNFLEIKIEKINLREKVGQVFLKSRHPLIITLHHNNKSEKIVSRIQKLNKKAKWIVIPHGTYMQVNKMVTDYDLNKFIPKKKKYLYKNVDFILKTSKWDFNDELSNGMPRNKGFVLGSPRYCQEWLKIKSNLGLDGQKVISNKKYKIKILFFLPKKFVNIFWDELIRTVEFISNYNEIDLILLDYDSHFTRFPNKFKRRDNIRFFLISREYSTSKLIDWADIIFHAGSSVIFEFLVKDKITVFPKYLSCNSAISDQYGAGYNLKNRDELREFCNQALSSLKNLKRKYKKDSKHNNKKYINDFVNGNVKSVPINIGKILSKIINSFD